MSEENRKTLNVYDQTAKVYLSNSIAHDAIDPEKAKRKIQYLNDKALDQASNPGYKYHRDYNGKERKRNNV